MSSLCLNGCSLISQLIRSEKDEIKSDMPSYPQNLFILLFLRQAISLNLAIIALFPLYLKYASVQNQSFFS